MNRRILLVEDDPANRYLVTFLLEGSGYGVTAATTGQEALRLASSQPFDLILLDIRLPDADGLELLQALCAGDGHPLVPVITVTAHAMAGDRERFLAAGAADSLEKPIDPDTFVQDVTRWLTPREVNRGIS